MTIPQSAMIIVAHPDDGEFMAAGMLAKWAREGCAITYCIVTNGNKGSEDESITPEQLSRIREQEQREAAKVIGAQEVVFLGFEDGMLMNDLELRRALVRVLRRHRPEAVICFDPTNRFLADNYLNHPDHRASGDAALDAVFPSARDRLMFPELLEEGLLPHKVREVYLGGTASPNYWEGITDVLDVKIEALRMHKSQLGDWPFEEMVKQFATAEANGSEYQYAEAFRRFVLE